MLNWVNANWERMYAGGEKKEEKLFELRRCKRL